MIPADFLTFFAASLTADGALIGLLFVAIAIEPERTFGAANSDRELAANGAFSALFNAFIVSMLALIPHFEIGWGVIVVAGLALLQNVVHTVDRLRRGQQILSRGLFYTISALALYTLEIYYGIRIIRQPVNNLDSIYGLIFVLVAVYGVALVRAWTLLGSQNRSFTSVLIDVIKGSRAPGPPARHVGDKPKSAPPA